MARELHRVHLNEWITYYHVSGVQSICGFVSFIIRCRAIFRDIWSQERRRNGRSGSAPVACGRQTRQQLLHSCKVKSGEATRARTPLRQLAEWPLTMSTCVSWVPASTTALLSVWSFSQTVWTLRYVEPCWPTFVHVFACSMTDHWLSLQKNHRSSCGRKGIGLQLAHDTWTKCDKIFPVMYCNVYIL
jgi:hypothetical protein